jgi:hypothetical protein
VKLVKNATLKAYPGAPHGLCTTLKDKVNADLPEFFRAYFGRMRSSTQRESSSMKRPPSY